MVFPVKYLPKWLPGMEFKRTAEEYKRTTVELTEKPFAFAKERIVSLVTEKTAVNT